MADNGVRNVSQIEYIFHTQQMAALSREWLLLHLNLCRVKYGTDLNGALQSSLPTLLYKMYFCFIYFPVFGRVAVKRAMVLNAAAAVFGLMDSEGGKWDSATPASASHNPSLLSVVHYALIFLFTCLFPCLSLYIMNLIAWLSSFFLLFHLHSHPQRCQQIKTALSVFAFNIIV